MQLRSAFRMELSELDDLFPCHPPPLVAEKAEDMLKSALTSTFEAAFSQGMQPVDALSLILSWVSSEMMRIRPDEAGESR